MIEGIKDQAILPKLVVIVPDNNLISYMDFGTKFGVSRSIGRILDWLMSEYDKIISSQKDYLPSKAKREYFPQIVWIEVPENDNFSHGNNLMRSKFNTALATASNFHDNEHVLELKKVWDPHSKNLFLKEERRFTATGLTDYWLAIDKTVKYTNTILFKKVEKSKIKKAKDRKERRTPPRHHRSKHRPARPIMNDRFHWTSRNQMRSEKFRKGYDNNFYYD